MKIRGTREPPQDPAAAVDAARPDGPATRSGREFRPAPGLAGPHRQTLAGRLARTRVPTVGRRECWDTPDGDVLRLRVHEPRAVARDAPLVLLLHGLGGSATSGYMRVAAAAGTAVGLRVYALSFRGAEGGNHRPRFYHSGETGDPRWVLDRLAARHPGAPIGALGFSLGGNVLVKLLGETGRKAPVRTAAVVSVPFDLAASARHLERGIGRLYTAYFLRRLRALVAAGADRLHGLCDLGAARRAATLREFDDAVTAPVHGFRDADDYYRRSSSLGYLERVRTPTLVVQALDDPFVPRQSLPVDRLLANPCLAPVLTARGGHVGFLAGQRPRFWAEHRAVSFLAERLRATGPGEKPLERGEDRAGEATRGTRGDIGDLRPCVGGAA